MPAKTIYTIDIINKVKPAESKLTAIEFAGHRRNPCGKATKRVLCECECGKTSTPAVVDVINGVSLSCGCLANELTSKRSTKLFPVIPKLYCVWHNMINRRYRKNNAAYRDYGAKGVTVCDEWRNDYQKFLDWAISNGWDENLRLDKDIKGNSLLYSPDTCIFVSVEENMNNTSRNVKHEFNGGLYTVSQIGRMTGVSPRLIYKRVKYYKWNIQDAINKPKYERKSN